MLACVFRSLVFTNPHLRFPLEHSFASTQEMLESCAGNCAAEYERQIPKLKKTIVDSLKNVQS